MRTFLEDTDGFCHVGVSELDALSRADDHHFAHLVWIQPAHVHVGNNAIRVKES